MVGQPDRVTSYIKFDDRGVHVKLGMSESTDSPAIVTPLINNKSGSNITNHKYVRGKTPPQWNIELAFSPDDDGINEYQFVKGLNDTAANFTLLTSEPAIDIGVYCFTSFTTTIDDVNFYSVSATIDWIGPVGTPVPPTPPLPPDPILPIDYPGTTETEGAFFARKISGLLYIKLNIGGVYEPILYLKRFLVTLGVYKNMFPDAIYNQSVIDAVYLLVTTDINYPYNIDRRDPANNINEASIRWIADKARYWTGLFTF